jgi:LPXTG-motif cell wall-anchored protein
VVFKSDAKKVVTPETPVTPEQPKKPVELPKTGPEHIILLLVAMLIGTGLILFRKKA